MTAEATPARPTPTLPQHELTTLFRGSSLAIKLVHDYGMTIGQVYLRKTLSEPLRGFIDLDGVSLQINPLRVEDAEQRSVNQERLVEWCTTILDAIIESTPDAPDAFRDLFDIFYTEVAKTFGDATAAQTTLCILFLRFFCPAIVKPFEAGILPKTPTKEKLEDLVLIAKVIQNLANNTRFGAKEAFMTPLNSFLDAQSDRLRAFFTDFITNRSMGTRHELRMSVSSASLTATQDSLQANLRAIDLLKSRGTMSRAQARIIVEGAVPEGFPIPPPPPDTLEEDLAFDFDAVEPTPAMLSEAESLRRRVANTFERIYGYVKTRPRERTLRDFNLSEGELKAAEIMMLNMPLCDELAAALDVSAKRRKSTSSSMSLDVASPAPTPRTTQFLRLLVRPDLLVAGAVMEMVKFSEASPVTKALVAIFSEYDAMVTHLIQYAIARELIIIYTKCVEGGTSSPSVVATTTADMFQQNVRGILRRWKSRYVVLEGHQINIYRREADRGARRMPSEAIPVFSIVDVEKRANSIRLRTNDGKRYKLRATDDAVVERWMTLFQRYAANERAPSAPGSPIKTTHAIAAA